jgi:hypothetical protein
MTRYAAGATGRRSCQDDKPLGGPGHGDIAVDGAFDARSERLRVDDDDEVELEPFRQLGAQRPNPRCRVKGRIANDTSDAVDMFGLPGIEDRVEV